MLKSVATRPSHRRLSKRQDLIIVLQPSASEINTIAQCSDSTKKQSKRNFVRWAGLIRNSTLNKDCTILPPWSELGIGNWKLSILGSFPQELYELLQTFPSLKKVSRNFLEIISSKRKCPQFYKQVLIIRNGTSGLIVNQKHSIRHNKIHSFVQV